MIVRRLRVELANRLADGADGSGASRAVLPTASAEGSLHGLELQSRSHARALDALGGDLAVAEEALAERYATHLQTFELQRRQAITDDELGAAAANVSDEPSTGLTGHRVSDAGVDEARLFHARDDFNRMPQRLARALEKCLLPMRDAQSVGADNTHAVRMHVAQPLTETLQASEGACGDLLVDAAVFFDARAETNHLAQVGR